MALPDLKATLYQTHSVVFSDDLVVTFRLQLIPGTRYHDILEEHRAEDGKVPHEAVAVITLTEGIEAVSSSIESAWSEFTEADATEIWDTWPDWARWELYAAARAYSTTGPKANPSQPSKGNENGG